MRRILLLTFLVPALVTAQGDPAQATGLKRDIIAQMNDAEQKLVALTNKLTQAQVTWRPNKDVRSYSEAVMHVALENYALPPMAGAPASSTKPAQGVEKSMTAKADVVDFLKKSFAYARQSVMAVPDAQMDVMADYFGTPMTKRGILISLSTHGHEHLGQLIAYARMQNVAPPWQ
jgi:hypothetical protein